MKHLRDMNIEELEATICEECKVNNMAEYMCPNLSKDNDVICSECCNCGECG